LNLVDILDNCAIEIRFKRASDARKVQKTKGKRKKTGKGANLYEEKKGETRTRTRMLKGPDTACEFLRGRVDVSDGARAPA